MNVRTKALTAALAAAIVALVAACSNEVGTAPNPGSSMSLLSTFEATKIADVEVWGDHVFLAGRTLSGQEFAVLDISDPGAPEVVYSENQSWGTQADIILDTLHSRAYVRISDSLLVFDITDPIKPTRLAGLEIKGYPSRADGQMALTNDTLLILGKIHQEPSTYGGVYRVDISSGLPSIVGRFIHPRVSAICAYGGYCILRTLYFVELCDLHGKILDTLDQRSSDIEIVTTGFGPSLLIARDSVASMVSFTESRFALNGSVELYYSITDLTAGGDLVCIGEDQTRISLCNMFDPSNPYWIADAAFSEDIIDMEVHGDIILVASATELYIYQVKGR